MIDGRPVTERKRLAKGGFCGRCGHHQDARAIRRRRLEAYGRGVSSGLLLGATVAVGWGYSAALVVTIVFALGVLLLSLLSR